jgi:hypothetical protein
LDGFAEAKLAHRHGTSSNAVLDASRVNNYRQQIALRVYRDIPLSTLDLFARVITAPPLLAPSWRIENRRLPR